MIFSSEHTSAISRATVPGTENVGSCNRFQEPSSMSPIILYPVISHSMLTAVQWTLTSVSLALTSRRKALSTLASCTEPEVTASAASLRRFCDRHFIATWSAKSLSYVSWGSVPTKLEFLLVVSVFENLWRQFHIIFQHHYFVQVQLRYFIALCYSWPGIPPN